MHDTVRRKLNGTVVKLPVQSEGSGTDQIALPRDPENLRATIRSCLRELDEERKTIRTVMARLRREDDEHNYETQAGKDSSVLRRLLPQEDDGGD